MCCPPLPVCSFIHLTSKTKSEETTGLKTITWNEIGLQNSVQSDLLHLRPYCRSGNTPRPISPPPPSPNKIFEPLSQCYIDRKIAAESRWKADWRESMENDRKLKHTIQREACLEFVSGWRKGLVDGTEFGHTDVTKTMGTVGICLLWRYEYTAVRLSKQ